MKDYFFFFYFLGSKTNIRLVIDEGQTDWNYHLLGMSRRQLLLSNHSKLVNFAEFQVGGRHFDLWNLLFWYVARHFLRTREFSTNIFLLCFELVILFSLNSSTKLLPDLSATYGCLLGRRKKELAIVLPSLSLIERERERERISGIYQVR